MRSAPLARRLPLAYAGATGVVALTMLVALVVGPVHIPVSGAMRDLVDHLPGVDLHSGLAQSDQAILWQFRAPRIVLGALVGGMLAVAGSAYQGAFRNPLADPYLLGVAGGAGLGATLAIVARTTVSHSIFSPVPLAAFAGALGAVVITYLVGGAGRAATTTTLVLAGVAVSSFVTAVQTYIQQRNSDVLREVYTWILGRLIAARWSDVGLVIPYVVVASGVIMAMRRTLDVLAVGDEEATTLGIRVGRARLIIVIAASLGTAAVVAVSGLIAFVGIIVPHGVRLVVGTSYRRIVPLSMLVGAAFLVATDLLARTVASPAEVPIGVITAFFGAPFFVLLLRGSRRARS